MDSVTVPTVVERGFLDVRLLLDGDGGDETVNLVHVGFCIISRNWRA